MALRTASVTGNWNDTATWGGSSVPVLGDWCVINAGITVTIPTGYTAECGDTTAANPTAINVAATPTGVLNMADGSSLIVHGNVIQGSAAWTAGAGCTITFRSDDVTGTPNMTWQIGSASNQASSILVVNATAGNPTTIQSHTSGGRGRFTSGSFLRAGRVQWTGVNATRIGGNGTGSAITYSNSSSQDQMWLDDCIFDASGKVDWSSSLPATGTMRVLRTTIKNPQITGVDVLDVGANATFTSGVRSVTDSIIQGSIRFGGNGWTFERCMVTGLAGRAWIALISGTVFASWKDIAVRDVVQPGLDFSSTSVTTDIWDRTYYWHDYANTNPHGPRFKATSANTKVRDWIIDNVGGTGTSGDFLQIGNPSSNTFKLTFEHCVSLPRGTVSPGALVSAIGAAGTNTFVDVLHCTMATSGAVGGEMAIKYNESYAGHAGMYDNIKSCAPIPVGSAPRGALVNRLGGGTPVQDVPRKAGITHNSVYNLGTGANSLQGFGEGGDTGTPVFTAGGTVNANGRTDDPQYVDPTRNLETWGISLGAASAAAAWAEMEKRNDRSGYDTRFTLDALCSYVLAGLAPQNSAYRAAHDLATPDTARSNGWIGAAAGISSNGAALRRRRRAPALASLLAA